MQTRDEVSQTTLANSFPLACTDVQKNCTPARFDVDQILSEHAPTGKYKVDPRHARAHVTLLRRNLLVSESDKSELSAFMETNVPKTPNPMNTRTFIRRKQATFGPQDYTFGKQRCVAVSRDWPKLIHRTLAQAKFLAVALQVDPVLYNTVHVNLYQDGASSLAPHADDEPELIAGMPIFSFTLLLGPGKPRKFEFYDKKKTVISSVVLNDGDVLIMCGTTQQETLHGLPRAPAKSSAHRLNLTVRAMHPVLRV